jgi:transglutaminase-like putative cysteine protease
MRAAFYDRYRMAFLGWLATVLMSFAFLPALSEKGFVFAGAFFSALVVLVGIGLRALRMPALLVLAVQLLALVELMLIFYGEAMKFVVFPTGETFDLLQTELSSAMDIAQKYAAPAPPSPGLTLMVVFYISVIAILVDFLAVTVHRVPLAGLPLLALYSVPVASLPHGVNFLGFLPGAIGYIAMLMVDERDRLAHWGRLVARDRNPDPDTTIDTSGLTASGRRISSLALVTAVVIPIFIPVFSNTLLDGPGNGDGSGGDSLSFSDPMVSLANSLKRKDPVDVLRVSGDIRPTYVRLAVLDQPGPNSWGVTPIDLSTTIPASSVLPAPEGLEGGVATTPHSMRIDPTSDFPADSAWLPVPFDVRTVNVNGDWSYVPQSQVVTANAHLAAAGIQSYDMSYASVEPTDEQLQAAGSPPDDIMRAYGKVPPGVPAIIAQQASAITAGAQTPYEQAVALQNYFRDPSQFQYDLSAGYGYGYESMVKFLNARKGFCQHFAATMAMMARELHIPSRVVVGFLQPERTDGDAWVITSQNVHAWPELYFAGIGWVKFEPTPGVGAPLPSYAPRGGVTNSAPTSIANSQEQTTETKGTQPTVGKTTEAAANGGKGGGGGSALPSRWWLVGILAAIALVTPAVTRQVIRRRRMTRPVEEGEAAEAAWVELRDHIIDLRLPWTGSMTPRARERAIEPMLEGDVAGKAALKRLMLTVERARYATSVQPGSRPAEDAREVMSVISKACDPGQRVLAVLWPASLLPDLRVGWARLRARMRRPQSVDA